MTRSKTTVIGIGAFLLGAVLPVLVIWNPAGWIWADHLVGRTHGEVVGSFDGSRAETSLWTCAMHPHIVREEPGNCPICSMRLTHIRNPLAASSAPPREPQTGQPDATGLKAERKVQYWRAPMDPNYTSDKPGKSPMGMDLVPVYEDAQVAAGGVHVDPNFLQNFAVRTAVAERGAIPIEIRTVGTLSHNEAGVVSVNTKFEGWIEKAYVHNIGEHITQGDVLLDVYSPELVAAQREYLAALDYVGRLSGSAYPEAVERARSLLEAARERLRYWDVTEDRIRRLEETRQAGRTVPVFAPTSGFIVAKMGDSLEGMRLTPGMTVLKLAGHARLWAEVELYEDDLRYVREGMGARIEVRSFPGRVWRGRVVLFDTAVDPKTRTLKAFVEIDNKDGKLRPMMYADVLFRPPAVSGAVKVPQEAVLHSGARAVVVVQKARGVFEPREVTLGPEGGGYQEIRSGLKAGEVIVTSSQFLIDSESNLKAAISQLLGDRPET